MRTIFQFVFTCMLGIGLHAGAVTIDTASLPDATVAEAYSATLAASDGTTPYEWNVRLLLGGKQNKGENDAR